MAGNFSDWSPYSSFVQGGMEDGLNATAAYMMLAAGPPRLANIGGAAGFAQAVAGNGQAANQIVLPMGLIQNFNLGQNRNFARMFEFGSERSYFIAGRTVGQLSLGRVYYHGASLLRLLYAYFQDLLDPTLVPAMFPNAGALATPNPHDVIIPPGYDNIFINLASDLFAQPIGIMMYMRDSSLNTLGAVYFEHVVIPSHNWGSDAQGVLIQEQVQAQFERAVPVQLSGVALVTSNTSPNASGANVTFPGIPGSLWLM